MKEMYKNWKQVMLKHIVCRVRGYSGATLVEYALMLVLIMVVCVTAVALIGTKTNTLFNGVEFP